VQFSVQMGGQGATAGQLSGDGAGGGHGKAFGFALSCPLIWSRTVTGTAHTQASSPADADTAQGSAGGLSDDRLITLAWIR
jgi:hypothetical protein